MTKIRFVAPRWTPAPARRAVAIILLALAIVAHSATSWLLSDGGTVPMGIGARLGLLALTALAALAALAAFRPGVEISGTGMLHIRNLGRTHIVDPRTVLTAKESSRGLLLHLTDGSQRRALALHTPAAVAQLCEHEVRIARALGEAPPSRLAPAAAASHRAGATVGSLHRAAARTTTPTPGVDALSERQQAKIA